MKSSFICFMAVVLFMGCSIKEVEKPIVQYTIEQPSLDIASIKKAKKVLKIDRFKSPNYLKSSAIWYIREKSEMNSYVYSSWSDDFVNILQNELADTLYKSSIFKSVFTKYSKIIPDFILEGEITEAVQIVHEREADVKFGIRLYLIEKNSSKLVSSKDFVYIQKCDTIDAKGAVEAYNKIIKKFDKDVISWLRKLVKEN